MGKRESRWWGCDFSIPFKSRESWGLLMVGHWRPKISLWKKWIQLRYVFMEPGRICLKWWRKVAKEETVVREKSGNWSLLWEWKVLKQFQAVQYELSVLGETTWRMRWVDKSWRWRRGWFTGTSGPNKEALVWVTGLPEELMIWISDRQNGKESQQLSFYDLVYGLL